MPVASPAMATVPYSAAASLLQTPTHQRPKQEKYTRPGSNWRPSACEADIIAATPLVPYSVLTHPCARILVGWAALLDSGGAPRIPPTAARGVSSVLCESASPRQGLHPVVLQDAWRARLSVPPPKQDCLWTRTRNLRIRSPTPSRGLLVLHHWRNCPGELLPHRHSCGDGPAWR